MQLTAFNPVFHAAPVRPACPDGGRWMPVCEVPNGAYIRLSVGGPVWVRGAYDRSAKRFSLTKFDDMNHESLATRTRMVLADFTF